MFVGQIVFCIYKTVFKLYLLFMYTKFEEISNTNEMKGERDIFTKTP